MNKHYRKSHNSLAKIRLKCYNTAMRLSQAKIRKKYNKLVIIFIVLTGIIVLFIGYFAFSKTTITVTTVPQEAVAAFETDLDTSQGKIFFTETEGTSSYTELTDTKTVDDIATGTVIIYNQYVADQPLVATTRLLSEGGVLFRTKEDVVVPKGGTVEVEVYADEAGKDGNIGPSKFEIVALNPVKKDEIYAQSAEKMTGGVKAITAVTQTDLANAKNDLIEELKVEAYDDIQMQLQAKQNQDLTLDADSLATEVLEESYSAQAGEEVEKIDVNLKIKAIALALNKKSLLATALEQVEQNLSSDYQLVQNISVDDLKYTLLEHNLEEETAKLQITYSGPSQLKTDATILDKEKLMGKASADVISYLEDFPEIEKATVDFSPFWVTTVPRIETNVKIIVQ